MARDFGLDAVRAAAIALVLTTHGSTFFFWEHYDVLAFSYVTGYFGVEIFFVLSGFLIGTILMKELVENGSWASLFRFYARRWLRTIPLYAFVMLITWAVVGRPFHGYALLFIQNFDERALGFMPVSWSLTIEEWFYLVVPFATLVLCLAVGGIEPFRTRGRVRLAIGLCVWIIVGEAFARWLYVLLEQPTWDYGVRKQIPLRLDSLVAGVLLAALKRHRTSVYERLRSKAALLSAVAALVWCGGIVYEHVRDGTIDSSLFARTLLFTIVSLALAICLASLEGRQALQAFAARGGRIARAVTFASVTSYAAYLAHWEIFIYYDALVEQPSRLTSWALSVFALTATLTAAYALHRLVERPFMQLREKLPGVRSGGSSLREGEGEVVRRSPNMTAM